ncbi:hypothetical protein NG54_05580 [Heyndrickxia ginsengihumi]|uniref:Uncharacterized protein n=1 Tax=Heyndrickxia ginsengihumi TaxID=363870 RepID=A0A0A6VES5_9BACI|nr:hypothetical protein NG54_05580 [Heyndrickxia ginsengihumi]
MINPPVELLPEPCVVFDTVIGEIKAVSPKLTVAVPLTFNICVLPMIAGNFIILQSKNWIPY